MDKTVILQQVLTVASVLNSIDVRGKHNLANLAGSIGILEDIAAALQEDESAASPDEQ